MINFRKRNRKTVHDYYSMDSFACGFETRAPPSDSLATTANFISWNSVIVSDVLLLSLPELHTSIFLQQKNEWNSCNIPPRIWQCRNSIRLILFATTIFQNITCLFFPLPILLTMKRVVGSGQKYRRGTDCCFQSSTGSVKNKSVQTCRTATGLRTFAGKRCTTSISLIHF